MKTTEGHKCALLLNVQYPKWQGMSIFSGLTKTVLSTSTSMVPTLCTQKPIPCHWPSSIPCGGSVRYLIANLWQSGLLSSFVGPCPVLTGTHIHSGYGFDTQGLWTLRMPFSPCEYSTGWDPTICWFGSRNSLCNTRRDAAHSYSCDSLANRFSPIHQ